MLDSATVTPTAEDIEVLELVLAGADADLAEAKYQHDLAVAVRRDALGDLVQAQRARFKAERDAE